MGITWVLLVVWLEGIQGKAKQQCGYKQCLPTREGTLNVHLIPHSHMDAGWVKTFDEYYHGTKSTMSSANVQLIYHSVLSEILHDKRRRFTFSETAYFWRWWKEQTVSTRAAFRNLVAEGRIQFAGGGWVQADEATTDYHQLLDQYTWGLRDGFSQAAGVHGLLCHLTAGDPHACLPVYDIKNNIPLNDFVEKLNDTLGECGKPKAAWQIDTYGHSREHTSLLAQMGFDGLIIGRVEFAEKQAMIEEDSLEFMWRGSDVLGKMSDIMTHTLYNQYNAPDGFCFDFLCSDEPVVDDPDSSDFNADQRVREFVRQVEEQAKNYDHDQIMVTMGGDFTYQSAANWFLNMDRLISYLNSHHANLSDINVFYSTPACYLKAVYLHGRRDKTIQTEKGDHMPYGSDANTYWTGFYTSRPSIKYLARRSHVFLQVVKQLTVLARMQDSYELHLLRHAVSLVLHHDGITGTSLQNVNNDFVKTISEAVDACSRKISQLLSLLTPSWSGGRRPKNTPQFTVCHHMNYSQCTFTETEESMLVVVYNPTSVKTYHHVSLPSVALHYSIRDYNDEEVEYQVLPIPTPVINLPGRDSTATQMLCFEAEHIPPLGYTAYFITPIRDQLEENAHKKTQQHPESEQDLLPYISNEYFKVSVDKSSGLLESIQHIDGEVIRINQNFYSYDQIQQTSQSGAYSFRPGTERPIAVSDKADYHTVRGLLIKEIRQKFNDWVSQVIRLYRGEEFVELEWIIGPIPLGSVLGKEVVSIYQTNITNHGVFFTDSNSRQMMKRTCRNSTKNNSHKKPVQACYYPVNSRICLQSQNTSTEVCVLTDRAQGGTSYNFGEIELMVHRRLLTDDGFGLEESLNEEEYGRGLVVRGKHRLFFGNFKQEVDGQSFSERASHMARKWTMEPWLFFTPGEKISRRRWQNVRHKRYTAVRPNGLPRHLHILTLEPWKGGSVLLRLENTLEKSDGLMKSDEESLGGLKSLITVDIQKIFLHHKVKAVRETTLAANQWLEEARQMDWSSRYVYPGGGEDLQPPEQKGDYVDEVEDDKDNDYQQEKYYRNRKSRYKKTRWSKDRPRRSINTLEKETEFNDSTKTMPEIINVNKQKRTATNDGAEGTEKLLKKDKDLKTEDGNNNNTISESEKFSLTYAPRLKFKNKSTREETVDHIIKHKVKEARKRLKNKFYDEDDRNDEFDDGITKSIYHMYYKTKSRSMRVFKPFLRSTTETREENTSTATIKDYNRRKNSMKDVYNLNRRRQKIDGRLHSIQTNKRQSDNLNYNQQDDHTENIESEMLYQQDMKSRANRQTYDEDNADEADDDENDDEEEEERENTGTDEPTRKKRSGNPLIYNVKGESSEQTDRSNDDFVFSLRPTQIRTYVIWFDESRRLKQAQNM